MRNTYKIERHLFDAVAGVKNADDPYRCVASRAMMMLSHFIVEEPCGGATFYKNRLTGKQGFHTKAQYKSFNREYDDVYSNPEGIFNLKIKVDS